MSEQNYQTLIPFIERALYNIVDSSDDKKQGFIDVTTTAAANDDFREALIDIAQNSNDYGSARRLAIRCLGQVAKGHDDARKALIDIAMKDPSKTDARARDAAHYRNTPIIASVAVRCLAELAPQHDDARQALIEIAKNDENESDRSKAMACLADLAPTHQDARAALEEIAQDERDTLSGYAAEALEFLEEQATIDSLAEKKQLLEQQLLEQQR